MPAPTAMASTFLSFHDHLVFSTKHREPLIAPEWRARLHEYLGGTVRGLGGHPKGVGGVADHVHLLVGLKATHTLANLLPEVKKASSICMHEEIVASSAMTAGFASTEAVPGISDLVAWALAQMIMLELAPRPTPARIQTQNTVRPVRAPVLVAFPGGESATGRAA